MSPPLHQLTPRLLGLGAITRLRQSILVCSSLTTIVTKGRIVHTAPLKDRISTQDHCMCAAIWTPAEDSECLHDGAEA